MVDIETPPPIAPHNDQEMAVAVRNVDSLWVAGETRFDRRLLQFGAQFSIALLTIGFCCYQLVRLPSCADQTQYMSLLTAVIGVYLPEPRMTDRGNGNRTRAHDNSPDLPDLPPLNSQSNNT